MSRNLSAKSSWVRHRTCESCADAFLTTTYDINRGWGKFCSRRCRAAAQNVAGPRAIRWKGGRSRMPSGYIWAATGTTGGRLEHVVVAERALGHSLPKGVEVHHVNGDTADNHNGNLVICQDAAYHDLLHSLMRVRAMGGRPFLDRICGLCRLPKPLSHFSPTEYRCKPCNAQRVANAKKRTAA